MAKKWPRPTEVLRYVAIKGQGFSGWCLGDWCSFFFLFYPHVQMMRTSSCCEGECCRAPHLGPRCHISVFWSSSSYLSCLLFLTYETGTNPALLALPALPGCPPHPMASVDVRSGS